MKTYWIADPQRYLRMTMEELRESFLIGGLSQPGTVQLAYVDLDRAIVGMASPVAEPIALPVDPVLRAQSFTERREIGILNIGGKGTVRVGQARYSLENLACLYVGRGDAEVVFEPGDRRSPPIYYLLSYPAHASYPTTLIEKSQADPLEIGSAETCNRRTVSKYIHLGGVRSCQLVMGVTHLHPGSSWNTMPPHTHMRRSEIYLYFNLPERARVFQMMGPSGQTRHLVMKDREAVVSPGWSIHSGVGTEAYSFCWGMGGENQDYADMDPVRIEDLR